MRKKFEKFILLTALFGILFQACFASNDNNDDDPLLPGVLRFGGPVFEAGYQLIKTQDQGFLIIGPKGHISPSGYVLKVNERGSFEWDLDSEFCCDVLETSDGSFMLLLYKSLLKLAPNGEILWRKNLIVSGSLKSFRETTEGDFIITGSAYDDQYQGVLLLKTDATGNEVWRLTYGTFYLDSSGNKVITVADGYVVTGKYYVEGNYHYPYALLLKTDFEGNLLWSHLWGECIGEEVLETAEHGFLIMGQAVVGA